MSYSRRAGRINGRQRNDADRPISFGDDDPSAARRACVRRRRERRLCPARPKPIAHHIPDVKVAERADDDRGVSKMNRVIGPRESAQCRDRSRRGRRSGASGPRRAAPSRRACESPGASYRANSVDAVARVPSGSLSMYAWRPSAPYTVLPSTSARIRLGCPRSGE